MKNPILSIFLILNSLTGLSQNKKEQIEVLSQRIDSCKTVIESQSKQLTILSEENKTYQAKLSKAERDIQNNLNLLNETRNQLSILNIENKKLKLKLDSLSKSNEMVYKIEGIKTFHSKESGGIKFEAKQTSSNQIELTFFHESSEECACSESETYVFKIIGSNIELIKIYDTEGYDPDITTIKDLLEDLHFSFHQTSGYLDSVNIQNSMSGECCQLIEGQYIIK